MTTDPLSRLIDSDEFRRFLGRAANPQDEAALGALADAAGVSLGELTQLRATMTKDERWRRFAREHALDRRSPLPWWVGLAAAVCIAVGGVAVWRTAMPTFVTHRLESEAVRTVATSRGERLAVRLADGTRVLLAPATTLRYAASYGGHERAVELDGEAAFTVVHDERRPFSVRAGNLVARDLGTEFIVRAYRGDRPAEVVVREGVVAVGGVNVPASRWAGHTARVVAGQKGRLDATGAPIVERADTAGVFAWTTGRLTFDRVPLADVIAQLSRWYDINIDLASSDIADRVFSATFRPGEPAAEVLRVIGQTLHLDVRSAGPRYYMLRAP